MKIVKKVIDRVMISFTESEKEKVDKYIKDNGYSLYATSHNGSNTMLYIGEKEKK